MPKFLLTTIGGLMMSVVAITAGVGQPAQAQSAVSADEAYEIAREAYVYLYPLVLMDVTRSQFTNVAPRGALPTRPMNTFLHVRSFPSSDFKRVVRPNFDTLYSIAWLDVTNEPVILSVPDPGNRYYLLPLMDMWTDVFAVIARRTTGSGDFAVAMPTWHGSLPAGVERIDSPTPFVWIIGRVQTNGPEDYAAVHRIQDAYRLTPLSQWGQEARQQPGRFDPAIDMLTPPPRQVSAMSAEKFFGYAAELMKQQQPHLTDQPILARMRRIGLEPGNRFEGSSLKEVLERAVGDARNALQPRGGTFGRRVNGWQIATEFIGVYGSSYMRRAVVAAEGLGANLPEDAIYPSTSVDAQNRPLDGTNRYVLRFSKGELPPADAFWSLTLYGPDGYPVANQADRYSVSDRDNLQYEPDGALAIAIQAQRPDEKQANWLLAPGAPFNLMLRLYAPRPAALDGRWQPPPVERLP